MKQLTDISNQEQVTLFLRWVSDTLEVHEEFLGLYHVPTIDAETLTSVIQDTFLMYALKNFGASVTMEQVICVVVRVV